MISDTLVNRLTHTHSVTLCLWLITSTELWQAELKELGQSICSCNEAKCPIFELNINMPDCTLCQQVRCLVDHGEFETQDGNIILLKKNTQVCLNIVLFWLTGRVEKTLYFMYKLYIQRVYNNAERCWLLLLIFVASVSLSVTRLKSAVARAVHAMCRVHTVIWCSFRQMPLAFW